MTRCLVGSAFAAVTALFAVDARAHIQLIDPPQRYVYTLDGQKPGPCGSGTASGTVTTYMPGQKVLVQWNETINHPGHFRISLDPDGGDDDLVDPTDYNDFYVAPSVLADDIPDTGGSTFSQEITLPMQECAKCTLQLIQVMTDKPPWGLAGGNDIYYWCADIAISASGSASSSGSAGSGGAPTSGAGGGATAGGAGAAGGAGDGDDDGGSSSSADEGGCTIGPSGARSSRGALCLLALAAMLAALRSKPSKPDASTGRNGRARHS